MKKEPWYKRLKSWISVYMYTILYAGLLAVLSWYILGNWEKCVSMQFFSRFDGNNILFLVWIILIILPFYDIEGKEIRIHRKEKKKIEDTEKKLQIVDSKFQFDQFDIIKETTKTQSHVTMDGGDKNDE